MLPNKYPHIFQPIRIGKLTLKNRITNSPTYNFLASYDNHVTREGIEFSKPVGRGGAGGQPPREPCVRRPPPIQGRPER